MTTEETGPASTPPTAEFDRLTENLAKIEALSTRLTAALAQRKQADPGLQGPSQDVFMKAASAYMAEMMAHPSKIIEQQVSFWGKSLKHYADAQQHLATGHLDAPEDPTPKDRRFADPMWDTNPYFNFMKQQYLFSAQAMAETVDGLEGLDDHERQRITYFSQQIADMMSPTNFLATNPEALNRAMETQGESLVKGLENLVADIEANDGDLLVNLADRDAFTVGENIATTPGKVVFRNRMLELIQYTPTTETVHTTPLVIFPPWINKFYVMDLKEKNSLIRWIVEQGFTLFVVSWKNPDPSYGDVGLDTYIQEGYLETIEEVKKITGQKQVNVAGYCIAGTTLSLVLALLNKRKDKSIKSATFFTTLTDFSDQGEFGVFLDDDFVDGIEREVGEKGILRSYFMSRTFSFLRSNDLIYGPAIKSYMLGEAPPAFDLLYWNGDSTNLPGRMAVEYLRWLCQDNKFVDGGVELMGETLKISDVKVPLCAIACETDHIAAWKDSYAGMAQMKSTSRMFILSESGHIAGIINPPSKKKYGHYVTDDLGQGAGEWRADATYHDGSWWPRWGKWLSKRAGKQIPARIPGESTNPVLCDAPGTYVSEDVSH